MTTRGLPPHNEMMKAFYDRNADYDGGGVWRKQRLLDLERRSSSGEPDPPVAENP